MSNNEKSEIVPFIIERVFNAPREWVWKAWTDPQYVARWWGPKVFSAPYCTIDLHVGGRFHYCMRAPDGKEYWNVGEFREIVAPSRLVSVMYFSDKDGNKLKPSHYGLGDDFPEETLDVVTFESIEGSKTKLTLRRNHSIEGARKYREEEGFGQSLDKFSDVLEQSARRRL